MKYAGEIIILPVKTRSDLHRFIDLPYRLYRNTANWVPPLRIMQRELFSSRHLFWRKNNHRFFIAIKDGRCAGRIAAFVNKEYDIHLKTTDGLFGFLEAENDEAIFRALFNSAIQFLQEQHCNRVIGPMNPDIHNELGILVKGFETPPYIMLTYHLPYYDVFIRQQGFSKLQDFYAYKMNVTDYRASLKMEKVAQRLLNKYSFTIRTPDMKQFSRELVYLHDIYNDAFVDHWGFVPIPKDEFILLAKDMKSIIDPRMVLIVERDNQPIAFLLALPNINEILVTLRNGRLFPVGIFKLFYGRKRIGSVRVITAAVKKKFQHLGLGAILYPELMKRGLQFGYHQGELSWVAEDNKIMNAAARQLAGEPYKTYRLYSRIIH